MSHIPRRGTLLAAVLALALGTPAWGQFGQNKITYRHFDWQVYRSPHFNVYYYPEAEPFLEEVVSHAESAYLRISRLLDHELRYRVPLVVYRTHGEFQQTNITLSEVSEGTGAFSEPIQNRMVVPLDQPPDKLYQLISHELSHIFEFSLFYDGYLGRWLRSNPPAWLMEGLASYLANDEDNLDRMWIRDAVVNGNLPSVDDLSAYTFAAYRYGHAIFDFIEQEHGPEGLRSFLYEYRKVLLTGNLKKAIKESFGYEVDTFNRNFERYLRRKYYPVLLEKKSPDDYGEEVGLERPGLPTASPTISPSGELIAALGVPGRELDLLVLSVEGGKKVKNLTRGYTNRYRHLVANAYEGKRDLAWSPTADHVAVFARREDQWPLLIFNAVNGRRVKEIVLKEIVECSSPAFSPDGKRVAFEGNRDGVVDIFEVDLETRAVRNLTRDDFFDANPWYSDDGKTLIYNRRIGAYWKIFTVDLSDPEKKAQLTFGPASDLQPSLSRDGATLFFASDRSEHQVFNLYALDLATAELRQYTDVVGGCFAPVEMAERAGDRSLVYATYYEGLYRLFRLPLKDPERIIAAEERFAEPVDVEPFEPPLSLRVDEPQKSPYKLKWDVEAPSVSVGVTDDGTFLSDVAVSFADLMGNHRFQIVSSTVDEYSNLGVTYFNLKRRFNWGASVYDFRDYFLSESTRGLERDQVNRLTGVNWFIQYPISRHYRVDASLGLLENAQDYLDPNGSYIDEYGFIHYDFDRITDRYGSVNLALTGDTTRYQSFGPFQGKRFRLSTWYAPHISGDSDGSIQEHRLDFRAYKQLTRRSLFAFRFSSIYNTGDRQNYYGFGGINQIRGYDYRDFVGSRLAWTNLEFRFPLIDILHFPIHTIFQIRGIFFVDVGAAWFEDDLWWDPQTDQVRAWYDLTAPPGLQEVVPIPFDPWNSEHDEFQDLRVSYGAGFNFILFGALQLNWIWARPLDYMQFDFLGTVDPNNPAFERVDPGTVQQFYIVFDF